MQHLAEGVSKPTPQARHPASLKTILNALGLTKSKPVDATLNPHESFPTTLRQLKGFYHLDSFLHLGAETGGLPRSGMSIEGWTKVSVRSRSEINPAPNLTQSWSPFLGKSPTRPTWMRMSSSRRRSRSVSSPWPLLQPRFTWGTFSHESSLGCGIRPTTGWVGFEQNPKQHLGFEHSRRRPHWETATNPQAAKHYPASKLLVSFLFTVVCTMSEIVILGLRVDRFSEDFLLF